MTLLVAGIEGSKIWMAADTAITDPVGGLRDREYAIKILPLNVTGLVGFAGSLEVGSSSMEKCLGLTAGQETIDFLLSVTRSCSSVDFAYAFLDGAIPTLHLISQGRSEKRIALHLGNTGAFSRFQEIRNRSGIEHAPEAVEQFICGLSDKGEIVSELSKCIRAMFEVFSTTNERDVGGWVVPYQLDESGLYLASYALNISDPIVNHLLPGTLIPHGSSESGGFSISFCWLYEHDGMVVYWLQKPGGKIFIKNSNGYLSYEVEGKPSDFLASVEVLLGRKVHVWFSDKPPEYISHISIQADEQGRPRMISAGDGKTFNTSWVQSSEESFRAKGSSRMGSSPLETDIMMETDSWKIEIADDKQSAKVILHEGDKQSSIMLSLKDMNELIKSLTECRSLMPDAALFLEPEPPRNFLVATADPAWRTEAIPHDQVKGFLLKLRHRSFGWVAFMIPDYEGRGILQWLTKYIETVDNVQTLKNTEGQNSETDSALDEFHARPLREQLGISCTIEKNLSLIGVYTMSDLKKMGSLDAYSSLCKCLGRKLPVSYLYAFEGAILGEHWHDLPKETKKNLRDKISSGHPEDKEENNA